MPDTIGKIMAAREALLASVGRTGRWAAAIAAVGGFVADVLNPLAPLAAWLAVGAVVATAGVLIAIVLRWMSTDRGGPALVFSIATFVVCGAIWGLQKATAAEHGVVAAVVPGIAELQQSVGLIQKSVERIETKVDSIDSKTSQIAESVQKIADGFASLNKQGGVIANPTKPEEFYHNARFHELGGDMVNARASYLAFARFGVDAIDPYLLFATLLRVQDGRAGAREVLGTLKPQNSSRALELAHILQFDDGPRAEKLAAFVAVHPDYGPVWKFLADDVSEDKLGQRSLADKRKEAEALAKFLSFEADGKLVPFFVDQKTLAEWLESARARQKALGNIASAVFEPSITTMPTNQGWMVTVSVPEAASEIYWRIGSNGHFIKTDAGMVDAIDPRTGKKMPNPSFSLQGNIGDEKIQVKYIDLNGREVGPFSFAFNPGNALADSMRKMLDMTWSSWLVFDASGNRGNLYYTQIVTMRCGVKEIAYSLNGDALDKRLDLPPCDAKKPYSMPDNFLPILKVGEDITSASVQLTYVDGTKSPVRTYKRE